MEVQVEAAEESQVQVALQQQIKGSRADGQGTSVALIPSQLAAAVALVEQVLMEATQVMCKEAQEAQEKVRI
jgi:hypothetical protein